MRKDRIAIIVGAIVALVVAAAAFAAKPTSSLNLVVLPSGSGLAAATSEPSQAGQITFDVSTTQTNHPSVNVRCYQDGAWVYDGWQSFWPGASTHEPIFTLSSLYWTSGAADCTARLLYFDQQGRERTLTSMGFHVAA
jgi:hypothetical protein